MPGDRAPGARPRLLYHGPDDREHDVIPGGRAIDHTGLTVPDPEEAVAFLHHPPGAPYGHPAVRTPARSARG